MEWNLEELEGPAWHIRFDPWLPTLVSTKLYIRGAFGPGARYDLIINDVAPANYGDIGRTRIRAGGAS